MLFPKMLNLLIKAGGMALSVAGGLALVSFILMLVSLGERWLKSQAVAVVLFYPVVMIAAGILLVRNSAGITRWAYDRDPDSCR